MNPARELTETVEVGMRQEFGTHVSGFVVFEENIVAGVGVKLLQCLQEESRIDLDSPFEAEDIGKDEIEVKAIGFR